MDKTARLSAKEERYNRESPEQRDEIANDWGDIIYFCVECDEEERPERDYRKCPRYPKEHDKTGYMGTGTTYLPEIRRLAKKISKDV